MKKAISIILLLSTLGMGRSAFGWYSKYKNETDSDVKLSVFFKSRLCSTDQDIEIKAGTTHPKTFYQGACNMSKITVRVPTLHPALFDEREYYAPHTTWDEVATYDLPFYGFTGTGTHTFTVKKSGSGYFVVRE